jgi:hypothetical protein
MVQKGDIVLVKSICRRPFKGPVRIHVLALDKHSQGFYGYADSADMDNVVDHWAHISNGTPYSYMWVDLTNIYEIMKERLDRTE